MLNKFCITCSDQPWRQIVIHQNHRPCRSKKHLSWWVVMNSEKLCETDIWLLYVGVFGMCCSDIFTAFTCRNFTLWFCARPGLLICDVRGYFLPYSFHPWQNHHMKLYARFQVPWGSSIHSKGIWGGKSTGNELSIRWSSSNMSLEC